MYFKSFEKFIGQSSKHLLSGIVLIMENKILLVHPHKFKDKTNRWSIPKGHVEKNMTDLESAIAELEEEANINIHPHKFDSVKSGELGYSKGSKEKELKFYVLNINRSEIGFKLYNDMILRYFLDRTEIAEAGFFSKQDAIDLIEDVQKPLLNYLQ